MSLATRTDFPYDIQAIFSNVQSSQSPNNVYNPMFIQKCKRRWTAQLFLYNTIIVGKQGEYNIAHIQTLVGQEMTLKYTLPFTLPPTLGFSQDGDSWW